MLVDIICGFLGAGKTTLINKLISLYKQKGEKIVIIENEYGSVNIDKYLFENENIAVYEMTSGCLCCTLKGNLELSLQEIRDHIQPDRVIIEPSGIFVIDEILTVFNTIEYQMFKLNQVITVVDSKHFIRCRHKYNALLGAQIKQADVIVVSKMTEETDSELLMKNIREFNVSAPIIDKPWDELTSVDMKIITDKRQKHMKVTRRKVKAVSRSWAEKREAIWHEFASELITAKENYTKEAFNDLLQELKDKNILRCKGFINVEHDLCIFQYVDGEYTLQRTFRPLKEYTLVAIKNM
ncbi:MAG: hypothetical protein K0S71_905 [Clostridia bacterium]|jgi:G3E family GTPase|nr:hypothetical protein [Clostridia bacterium]